MFHDSRSGNQRALRTVLYFCLALLLSALPALAQTITGRIDGKVTDSSGGVLPGATVTPFGGLTVQNFQRQAFADTTGLGLGFPDERFSRLRRGR